MKLKLYSAWCPADGADEFYADPNIAQQRESPLEDLRNGATEVVKRYINTEFITNVFPYATDHPLGERLIQVLESQDVESGYDIIAVRHGYIRFYRIVEFPEDKEGFVQGELEKILTGN